MTNPNLIDQYLNSMRIDERPKAFPQMGGAYDSRSLLIYTKIQGNKTYKDRLDRFVTRLSKLYCKTRSIRSTKLSPVCCSRSSAGAPGHCFNLKDRPIAMSSPLWRDIALLLLPVNAVGGTPTTSTDTMSPATYILCNRSL